MNGDLHRHALPVGKQVHRDEVDLLHELGVRQPHVPGLGGGDRHIQARTQSLQDGQQVLERHKLVQLCLVACDDTLDAAAANAGRKPINRMHSRRGTAKLLTLRGHRRLDGLQFLFVARGLRVEPDPCRQAKAMLPCQLRQRGQLGGRIGAQARGDG